MRDAESTLDQLISFCGENIEENDVLSMFGLVAQHQIIALAHALLTGRLGDALRLLEELARHGKDLTRLLAELLSHFRTLLLYHLAPDEVNLIDLSETETAALADQAALADAPAVSRIMEILIDYEWRLRDAPSKRILLEVALLKAIDARHAVPIDAVLRHLQTLRGDSNPTAPGPQRAITDPAPSKPTANSGPETSAPSNADTASPPAPASPASSTVDLGELWRAVLEAVGRASPFARSYLLEAHPVSFADQILTIGFDPQFSDHQELFDNIKNRTIIQTKLKELGYGNAHVKIVRADAPSPPITATPVPPNQANQTASSATAPNPAAPPLAKPPATPHPAALDKNDFKADPLIQKALEIFKGQIVEIRAN
jgi:DNA polymerase-3 subunit gamma/tau